MADTRSLLIADIKELNIRNLYREERITDSLYKCTAITNTNVANTVTPSWFTHRLKLMHL